MRVLHSILYNSICICITVMKVMKEGYSTLIINWFIRSQAREQGLAWMLFCVVAVFFFCNLLALVVNILEVGRVASAGQINLGLVALLFSFILFKVLSQQEDFSPLKQYFLATWSQDFKWSIIYFWIKIWAMPGSKRLEFKTEAREFSLHFPRFIFLKIERIFSYIYVKNFSKSFISL